MITTIREFRKINENIGSSHQQRFNQAIYLTYVEQGLYNEFKHTSKEVFEEKLGSIVAKKDVKPYDLNYQYRIADEKEIWYDARNNKIGEIFRETGREETSDWEPNVESYWINAKYL